MAQDVPQDVVYSPTDERVGSDALNDTMRLQQCGLVHHLNVLTSQRWIGPPERILDGNGTRIQRLPLHVIKPQQGMEIRALDGERYAIEGNPGSWFDVASPTGKRLIQ